MDPSAIVVAAIALSVALSFFASGMEAGVFALSRLRIRLLEFVRGLLNFPSVAPIEMLDNTHFNRRLLMISNFNLE